MRNEERNRLVLEELLRRKQETVEHVPDFFSGLFEQQLEFVNDPARFKAACCSRRSGKTHSCIRYLYKTAYENPRTVSAYVALTKHNAKNLVWRPMMALAREMGLTDVKFNKTELVAELPNGSMIIVTSASDEQDIEKLRGFAFKLVVLDECASFPEYIRRPWQRSSRCSESVRGPEVRSSPVST